MLTVGAGGIMASAVSACEAGAGRWTCTRCWRFFVPLCDYTENKSPVVKSIVSISAASLLSRALACRKILVSMPLPTLVFLL